MKLNGSNVEGVDQRSFERGKRKPKVESLHYYPIHKKVMGRVRVNHSDEFTSVHRIHNDITFLPGAG
jgi:hypothetical protein